MLKNIRIVCFLFTLALGSVVYAADAGIGGRYFEVIRSLPLGDKVSHFLLMGTLAVLVNMACRCTTLGSRSMTPGVGTVLVAIVVVAEEISQIWIPGRNFELFDLGADFLGIACGDILARRFWQRSLQ